ncbi:MAG: bifunctional phosphoribosylaminoimidazolecarboxamide formyltransferase/IMP cyclohydrolase [Deltaproteobacteria bacterium]|nr:bifunctional phosphoribosylaminoimidazolecarboxamide formyltransferase/IMP cyclohydrolase [Deltaproteobacteria bacterium]
MQKAALISVSDRRGLVQFAQGLEKLGYLLLVTSGTHKALTQAGVPSTLIEDYTGQKEILGGRVKTLHPRIHAGLLARREHAADMQQLQQDQILPIDVVAVNLYPFIEGLASEKVDNPDEMVELVDIGGPTMLRAAAKNFRSVWSVIDPSDYTAVLHQLEAAGESGALELRRKLAVKVFASLANYNLQIAKYLCNVKFDESGAGSVVDSTDDFSLGEVAGHILIKQQTLRYGENPHQRATYYRDISAGKTVWQQLNGKELSYNNLLDINAALQVVWTFSQDKCGAVIVKHLTPCGAALDVSLQQALIRAKCGDPRSHFGGVIAFNNKVDEHAALEVSKDFTEIVVAPDYTPEGLDVLRRKANLRVIQVPVPQEQRFEIRSVDDGVLIQERDQVVFGIAAFEIVSQRRPTPSELEDLQLAWSLCLYVKSNAIVFVKDQMLLAAGAGQTSRIDATEVAVARARVHNHNLRGAVAASDAFFPFTDCLQLMSEQGISAVAAPRGAKRDDEVIETADRLGICLLFGNRRHFRH